MKQTHTPGPWRVTPKGNETFIDSDGGLICDIKRNARLDCQETYQCDANARLISAAPDLLDALQTFLAFWDELSKSNPGFMGKLFLQDYAQWNEALLKAPSAIKKATGQ